MQEADCYENPTQLPVQPGLVHEVVCDHLPLQAPGFAVDLASPERDKIDIIFKYLSNRMVYIMNCVKHLKIINN